MGGFGGGWVPMVMGGSDGLIGGDRWVSCGFRWMGWRWVGGFVDGGGLV